MAQLLGVQIAYCDADGKEKRVWLNLQQVKALAWTRAEVKSKPPDKRGNTEFPSDPSGPGKCRSSKNPGVDDPVDEPICWWTGSQWVCG